jgi:murein DD-endopeptidase MepM/ murein hydrolase activator NlpD
MNILGYGPEAMMGSEPIIVSASDAVGNVASVTATLTVTRFVFPVEDVRQEAIAIPSDRVGLLAPEIANAEAETLGKVFGSVRPARLWEGLFLVPAPGEETSPFAIRRSYNGGPLGSFHAGVDLGMKSGTAVVAANSGVVVLAEPLRVRGNAIIIDHGLGLFTAYYHLSQIQVRVGQLVKKGDRIGYSGDTGLSTGPHLHWEMRVGGEPVDPWEWTRRVIP